MNKKLLAALAVLIFILIGLNWFVSRRLLGSGVEGLFKIGNCVRDDEFGVTYKVTGAIKGRTGVEIVLSERYPSHTNYKVGTIEQWPSNENSRKLYAVTCP